MNIESDLIEPIEVFLPRVRLPMVKAVYQIESGFHCMFKGREVRIVNYGTIYVDGSARVQGTINIPQGLKGMV